jgi:manganese/zinc/iron transport system substrate-binding protein
MAGCDESSTGATQGQAGAASGGKLKVVCTTTMITDLAQRIAGDDAQVLGIMKTGEDPHVYDVRPRDAQLISDADVVLMNGLHLESTLLHIIEHNAEGALVAALAEDERIKTLGSETIEGAPDPHCWFNVQYFKVYAERARDALAKADPGNAEAYKARAQAYFLELDALDAFVAEQISSIPRDRRVMVTSHDAFQYYGNHYGIDVLAVIGISTEQQPRPQDIVSLESQVKERGVKALFIETSVSRTLNDIVKKIADATGASIGGTLYSDSLGDPGTDAGTYIGMVRHNTTTITKALR